MVDSKPDAKSGSKTEAKSESKPAAAHTGMVPQDDDAQPAKTSNVAPVDRVPAAESSNADVHNLMARKDIALQNGDTDAAQEIDKELRKLGVKP